MGREGGASGSVVLRAGAALGTGVAALRAAGGGAAFAGGDVEIFERVGAGRADGAALRVAAGAGAATGRVAAALLELECGLPLAALVRTGATGSGCGLTAGARSGRMAANCASARCIFGVSSFVAPCATIRVSMMIMITPTRAPRVLTVRTSTAERISPRSRASTDAAPASAKASTACSTALCSSGPIELSLSHSTSPSSSCRDTAWVRAGSTAARTF